MGKLTWHYTRDECWGDRGEPLLRASLVGDELSLTVRNSSQYGFEVIVSTRGVDEYLADPDDGPVLKLGMHEEALQTVRTGLMPSGEALYVTEPLALLARIQCGNRLRVRAKRKRQANWYQLDAEYEDLQLGRLLEPAAGIVYQTHVTPPVARPAGAASRGIATPAAPAAPDPVAELMGAVAPLASMWAGHKLAKKFFGPSK